MPRIEPEIEFPGAVGRKFGGSQENNDHREESDSQADGCLFASGHRKLSVDTFQLHGWCGNTLLSFAIKGLSCALNWYDSCGNGSGVLRMGIGPRTVPTLCGQEKNL